MKKPDKCQFLKALNLLSVALILTL